MKFIIEKASTKRFREERGINTIEDLKKLADEYPGWHGEGDGQELIVCFGCKYHSDPTITIYDDYIE